MDAFYQTVAGFCFTLLGLWWAVVQFRHAEWMRDLYQRRAAYSVHLSFLVPGIMSLGAMIAGDVKILWRLVFVVACAFGILAMLFLTVGASAGGGRTHGSFFIRQGRWLTIALYALIAIVAAQPSLAGIFGGSLKPLQVEGLLLTLLVFVGVSVAWDFLAEPQG
jgi:cell division protein FtsW (lipid II flippase)